MTNAAHLVTQSGFSCPQVRLDSAKESSADMHDLVQEVQSLYSGYSQSNNVTSAFTNANMNLVKDTRDWAVLKLRNISWDVSVYNLMEYFDGFKVISTTCGIIVSLLLAMHHLILLKYHLHS